MPPTHDPRQLMSGLVPVQVPRGPTEAERAETEHLAARVIDAAALAALGGGAG